MTFVSKNVGQYRWILKTIRQTLFPISCTQKTSPKKSKYIQIYPKFTCKLIKLIICWAFCWAYNKRIIVWTFHTENPDWEYLERYYLFSSFTSSHVHPVYSITSFCFCGEFGGSTVLQRPARNWLPIHLY